MAILKNDALNALAVFFQSKVDNFVSLKVTIDDNVGGNTVIFEGSNDNSAWSTLTNNAVYNVSDGNMTAISAGLTTGKGKFWIDCTQYAYVRVRMSVFVAGFTRVSVEEAFTRVATLPGTPGIDKLKVGLVAAGTNQSTGLQLTAELNVIATAPASSAFVLPAGTPLGTQIIVSNKGANAVLPYPPVGGKINTGAVNAAGTALAAGSGVRFASDGANNYWSI
jgi:hypothetical protein